MANADWNPEKTPREFRVRKVTRYIVTDWSDYRGCVESTVKEVCGASTLEQANAIAAAFGAQHPGCLINPMDPEPESYGLSSPAITDDQIRQMVDRFLAWKLPKDFRPDGGITFKAEFNEHTAHPMRHEPMGTNLLDATQATAMVRHMLGLTA